ncbi:hypothetical protein [Arthrobacter ulcerisalmonis]|uniref:hypothetical protein n=1 Tax=Arthrobacter ulcerisalmonis TaxID=2483813 RepID=UPI003645693A
MSGALAGTIADVLRPVVGGELPVRLKVWDGSEAGPLDAPVVLLQSPDAIRRLLWAPGELGAAQAYVTGELEIEGDLNSALQQLWEVVRQRKLSGIRPTRAIVAGIGKIAGPLARWGRHRLRLSHRPRSRDGCTACSGTGRPSATTTISATTSTN